LVESFGCLPKRKLLEKTASLLVGFFLVTVSFNVTNIKKEGKFKTEFKYKKTQKATSNFEIKFGN
jgi:hypothetical protein